MQEAEGGWVGVGRRGVGSVPVRVNCVRQGLLENMFYYDGNWYHLPTESMEFVMKKYWFGSRHCSHFLSKRMSRAMNSVAVDTIAAMYH